MSYLYINYKIIREKKMLKFIPSVNKKVFTKVVEKACLLSIPIRRGKKSSSWENRLKKKQLRYWLVDARRVRKFKYKFLFYE